MRRNYRRTRTDYPAGVVAVYDDGSGKYADRYTVVYEPYLLDRPDRAYAADTPVFPYVSMSGAPFHPQGVCQHSEAIGQRPTGGWGGTCGKVIRFEDLPEDCQKAVLLDLDESERFGNDGLNKVAQGRNRP
jgi:hypothetical protein